MELRSRRVDLRKFWDSLRRKHDGSVLHLKLRTLGIPYCVAELLNGALYLADRRDAPEPRVHVLSATLF